MARGIRHQTQPDLMDPMRREAKDSGEEAELIICDRDVNSSIRRRRIGDSSSVYTKTSPSSIYAYSSISRGWIRAP